MAETETAPQEAASTQRPDTLSLGASTYCACAGLLWPIFWFFVSYHGIGAQGVVWQSGSRLDLMALTIGGPAYLAFLPLQLYSMACLSCFLGNEAWARQFFWVRAGIYGGLVLAVQFGLLQSVVICDGSVMGTLVCWLLGALFLAMPFALTGMRTSDSQPLRSARKGLDVLLIAAVLIFFPFFLMLGLLFAPWITALAYLLAAAHLGKTMRPLRFRILDLLGAMVWLSALAASWRAAWQQAVAYYGHLPTTPPSDGCFIATAAASGHPRLVRSWQLDTCGRTVNWQLLRLKAGELYLQDSHPRLHRHLRAVYNRLAPPIARRIRNRWLADVFYVLLKPLELLACCGLVLRKLQENDDHLRKH